jgi:predicted glycosyltransferase
VGRHPGRHKLLKIVVTAWRALQLVRIALSEKPDLAISHGSRSQLLACALLRTPCIEVFDYEFASVTPCKPLLLTGRNWLIGPEVLSHVGGSGDRNKFLHYPGIKEDVYVPRFKPDARIKSALGLPEDRVIVTVRPPADDAHYFDPETERVFNAAMSFLLARPDTKIVLLPRNRIQRATVRDKWPAAFDSKKIIIPEAAVDGLNLIWHSDLVISGGGTMNREAAALGVPVYSVYRGRIGAVDQYLCKINRLVLIESPADVERKIVLKHRPTTQNPSCVNRDALSKIVENVMLVLRSNLEFAT